ncbi:histidine phosphatase family protein [Actinomarinicola tropica]|uniref:Histidine phosphatase family protein n=1 Tax=Actinomarinicola tropica TaxID=2789776 RepID=A0A5Q2RL82_9ACTN|nr:histidine phosphatase family protein [Actinomarinicola tropica]QGG94817.1 histidine phosphatase family protein [Actinomarinicola tropica]
MPRLHLVRHGAAAAGYSEDPDPGLDDMGRVQAVQVAAALATKGPLPILVSPLRRCRETAAPLEALWGATATVEAGVAEVAAPTDDLAERGAWLRRAMAGTWDELEDAPRAWRTRLLDTLAAVGTDTVVVTHFIAINAVLGAASADDRVLVARLDNGSITTVDAGPDGFEVVSAGPIADTEVL